MRRCSICCDPAHEYSSETSTHRFIHLNPGHTQHTLRTAKHDHFQCILPQRSPLRRPYRTTFSSHHWSSIGLASVAPMRCAFQSREGGARHPRASAKWGLQGTWWREYSGPVRGLRGFPRECRLCLLVNLVSLKKGYRAATRRREERTPQDALKSWIVGVLVSELWRLLEEARVGRAGSMATTSQGRGR